jgi:drug/metabolite transporter (DMT)-like permease
VPNLSETWPLFAWVLGVCMLAGATSVYRRHRNERFSTFEVFGEICVSGFAGLMTFMACLAFKLMTIPPDSLASASMVSFFSGIAAHSAARFLALYDRAVEKRAAKVLGIDDEATEKGDSNGTA